MADAPAMPVIRPSERDTREPYPLLPILNVTIGWQFRGQSDGGCVYVILRRRALGCFKILERFPLTEEGWSRAWQSFVRRNPAAVPRMLETLRVRTAEAAREDVERGLVLLALQAQAADRRTQGWVKRRVEQLEILDTRAVRWRVSIDFEVPVEAPVIYVGSEEFRLIPIMTLPKGDLVSFDLRDGHGAALWLPTSDENNSRLAPALVVRARRLLHLNTLPGTLEQDLMRIVATLPSRHREAYRPFAAAAAKIDAENLDEEVLEASAHLYEDRFWHIRKRWRASRDWGRAQGARTAAYAAKRAAYEALGDVDKDVWDAVYRLMADRRFRSLLEELEQNYVLPIAIPVAPMSRRIIKLTSERTVTFWSTKSKLRRLLQSLGWRCWPLDVLIGGRGGSHHLEVAAPPGVDVVRIAARPIDRREPQPRAFKAAGFSPHVHISIPALSPFRYRATIDVRTSRGGWLFSSLLVGGLIATVMMLGRHNLKTLFDTSPGEAGTAATLLLALLGVIALWLIRPGEHPLASRLLSLVGGLILMDVAVVLSATGDLVLQQATSPLLFTLWSVLAWTSVGIAVILTLSWLMPRRLPWRSGKDSHPGYASQDGEANR